MNTVTFTTAAVQRLLAVLAIFALIMSLVPLQAGAQVAVQIPDDEISGNPNCLDLSAGFSEIKLETEAGEVSNGTYQGITLSNVTFKESNPSEPMTFDWSKASGEKISAVIVKAGNVGYVYEYNPAVDSDINLGVQDQQAISHISFCYIPDSQIQTSLTLTKIVSGGSAEADDWTLKILGTQGNIGAGSVTKIFENFSEIGNPEWELIEEPTDPDSAVTDNYVAGLWQCDGGTLDDNWITLEEGDDVICTITNTYEEPAVPGCTDSSALNYNADATEDNGSCQYLCAYSDTTTTIDGNPSILTYVHPVWTDEFDGTPAEWIWDSAQVTTPNPQTLTFRKTFFSPADTTGELKIAVDNFYTATLNGGPVSCDGATGNNHAAADSCTVSIQSGVNTLEIEATNATGPVNYQTNPAGVIYTIVTDGSSCTPVDDLGSITIVKEVAGEYEADWAFDFIGDLGDFTLDKTTFSQTFTSVVPGEYLIDETMLAGWAEPMVSCDDGNSGPGQGDDLLVVALGAGEDVTCTITNRELPTFTISGYKYFDVNKNGEVDDTVEEQAGIEDWEFELYYEDVLVDTTTTNEDGYYEFVIVYEEGKYADLYEVREVMPNENSDWEMTALYVQGERAEVCRYPEIQQDDSNTEQTPVLEARVSTEAIVVRPIESINLRCDFLNFKPLPANDEEEEEDDEPRSYSSGTRVNRDRDEDPTPRVAGVTTTPEPTPLILGEQVSAVPYGAPNTGAGGTSVNITVVGSFLATPRRFTF